MGGGFFSWEHFWKIKSFLLCNSIRFEYKECKIFLFLKLSLKAFNVLAQFKKAKNLYRERIKKIVHLLSCLKTITLVMRLNPNLITIQDQIKSNQRSNSFVFDLLM